MRSGSPKYLADGKVDEWDVTGVLLDDALVRRGDIFDFAELFGNDRPVEIEIGTGKGTFLLARASARPEVNFLGIEWARAYCLYSADRFRRNGLENVRMLRADASEFFRKCLADESIFRLHIYFPDPWPKKKHHRRRLIQPKFLDEVQRVLKPGGQLIVVTDHLDYFYQIRQVVDQAKGLLRVAMPKMTDQEGELVGTNFERKYIAQGRPFYSVACLRYV